VGDCKQRLDGGCEEYGEVRFCGPVDGECQNEEDVESCDGKCAECDLRLMCLEFEEAGRAEEELHACS